MTAVRLQRAENGAALRARAQDLPGGGALGGDGVPHRLRLLQGIGKIRADLIFSPERDDAAAAPRALHFGPQLPDLGVQVAQRFGMPADLGRAADHLRQGREVPLQRPADVRSFGRRPQRDQRKGRGHGNTKKHAPSCGEISPGDDRCRRLRLS